MYLFVFPSHLGVSHESNAETQLPFHATTVAAARLISEFAQPEIVATTSGNMNIWYGGETTFIRTMEFNSGVIETDRDVSSMADIWRR